jgi:hypothetical protein
MALDVLLLLALPAAGKSEIRTYLGSLDEPALADLGFGPQVHLDDYPYVHLMRRLSAGLRDAGRPAGFFADDATPMLEPRDWGTLIHLVNEDFGALHGEPVLTSILDRFDQARIAVGAEPVFDRLPDGLRSDLEELVAEDVPPAPEPAPAGATIVIEFARGGPEGAEPPLPDPLGYQYSLRHLAPDLLRRASVLYVWVTPEESRRRNRERAEPGPEGDASILHHGVPEVVMRQDYGMDDLGWMLETSGTPGHIAIEARGERLVMPTARFDNRDDRTSFLRDDPAGWPAGRVAEIHRSLAEALAALQSPG